MTQSQPIDGAVAGANGAVNAIVFESLPTSGLANQLRGLTSAMLLAEDLERDFYLSWNQHQDMPDTSLSDLFRGPKLASTTVTAESFSRLQRWRWVHRNRKVSGLLDQVARAVFPHHQFNNIGCDMVATGVNPAYPLLLISSYYSYALRKTPDSAFYSRRHALYKRFVPVPEVEEAIERFVENSFGPHTLGVHLRTGVSIRNAKKGIPDANHFWPGGIPFEVFFALIDEEIASHPNTIILLTTDNVLESDPFLVRYSDRIVVYPKQTNEGMVGRSSLEDHKGALIDLFLLSRTQKLIGTYNSTFSYEAAVIGDVPFIEIGPMGVRQVQNLGNGKEVIIDFRDRTILPVEHTWLRDDKTRKRLSSPDSVRNRSLDFFHQELMKIKNPVVVDFGAETGCYSLLAKFVEGSRFYAFEENQDLAEILRSNVRLNHVESRVHVISSIETDTIDVLLASQKLDQLDFIKIRFDEATLQRIRGAGTVIRRFRPSLMVEIDDSTHNAFPAEKAALLALPELRDYQVSSVEPGNIFCTPGSSAS